MNDPRNDSGISDLDAYIDGEEISEGQKSRLRVFQGVEGGVCTRVEELCEKGGVDVTDVGVLVIAPRAHSLFFDDGEESPGTDVVLGHRSKLYAFLRAVLPPAEGAPIDPYVDLLEPSPTRCVRVLIIDDESITVLCYGTFVTVRMDPANRAVA